MAEAEATDAAEDEAHGRDRHGDELPDELKRRESRLAKILEAKALLEERARAEAAEEAARRRAEGKGPPTKSPAEAVPEPKDQINFTDPESRIMKVSNKGWDRCGNAQAVANEDQIILAADVTDQANDKHQAVPMVDQTLENLEAAGVEQPIGAAVIDSGYYSEANASALEQRSVETPHRDPAVESAERGNPPGTAWSDCQALVGQATDGAKAANQERPRSVRQTEGDHRADLWSAETGARNTPVLDAGSGGHARRMAIDVHGAQSAEAVAACSISDGGVIDPA